MNASPTRGRSSFQLVSLPAAPFADLFALSDEELAARHAIRVTAASDFGFPCRISLQDAAEGDELLLLPFEHQPADSPYRATGPIYVRRGVASRQPAPGVVTDYVAKRLISFRAYDAADLVIEATVREGTSAAAEIERLFDNPAVCYLHLHNARHGCFLCRVDRVSVAVNRK